MLTDRPVRRLSCLIVVLLAQTQYYATALVLAGIAALIASGLTSRISNLARLAADESGDSRRDRAEAALSRELDHAHALLDTVPAALFVLEQGRVVYLNRAARELARETPSTLAEIPALGGAAKQMLVMRPAVARDRAARGRIRRRSCPARRIRPRGRLPAGCWHCSGSPETSMRSKHARGATWPACWRTR